MASSSGELQKGLSLTASGSAVNDQIGIGAALDSWYLPNCKATLIASACDKLSSDSVYAFGISCVSHGALQTPHFKPFHAAPTFACTDRSKPRVKYRSDSPTTLLLRIANAFVVQRGK